MRGSTRAGMTLGRPAGWLAMGALALMGFGGCQTAPSPDGVRGAGKSSAEIRAERRLFDGAPPVIPHERLGSSCVACHNEEGMAVEGVGFAPPSPHELTAGLSALSRCEQCHVFASTAPALVENSFVGIRQDLRRGERLALGSPPVMPHALLMRENCRACHSGPAAREEIRTDHPERANCSQCHVEQVTGTEFSSPQSRLIARKSPI